MSNIKNKYIELLIKILLYVILIIKFRSVYLNPLYWLIEKYYSKRIEIIGKENIPKNDGYVIISNHNFVSEVFMLRKIFNENMNIIRTKSLLLHCIDVNGISIQYDKKNKNSGKKIKKIILAKCKNEKKNILVFPEGNWTNINEMFLFKKGLFYLCFENNIPIVPIIFLIKKRQNCTYWICLDKKIKIKIFKKVYPNDFNDFDEYYNFIYNLMNDYLKKYINDTNTKYSILF